MLVPTAQVHRVRFESSSTASLRSNFTDPEEGVVVRDVAGGRVRDIHSHSAQHLGSGYDGASTHYRDRIGNLYGGGGPKFRGSGDEVLQKLKVFH